MKDLDKNLYNRREPGHCDEETNRRSRCHWEKDQHYLWSTTLKMEIEKMLGCYVNREFRFPLYWIIVDAIRAKWGLNIWGQLSFKMISKEKIHIGKPLKIFLK